MLYAIGQKGPLKVSGYHDPDSIRRLTLIFRPSAWAAGTVYNKTSDENYDCVLPTSFKGLYYAVDNPGKSHASTEPTWKLTVGDTTNDFEAGQTEGLTWTAKAYNLLPVTLDVSTVTFTATQGVTLVSSSNTTTTATFTIDAIAADADARTTGSFQVRGRGVLSNDTGFDVTLEFKLAEW